MTTTVVVLGGFGRGDAGAEARLRAVLAGLEGAHVVAVSDDPGATEAAAGCSAVPATLAAVGSAVRTADGLVVAGGDLFGPDRLGTGDRRLAVAALAVARARSVPAVLIGVGATGPVRRSLDEAIVRLADLVVLRDRESASLLADGGLPAPFRVAADLAWATLPVHPPGPRGESVAVIVDGALGRDHAAGLARSVMALEAPARVVPWRADAADLDCARAVASMCGDAEVVGPPAGLDAVVDLVADARLVVTERAHGALAAAGAGRHLLAVGETPEVAGVARALGQPHVAAHAPDAVLARAMAGATAAPVPTAERVGGLVASAEDALALARLVVGVGGAEPGVGSHTRLEGGPLAW